MYDDKAYNTTDVYQLGMNMLFAYLKSHLPEDGAGEPLFLRCKKWIVPNRKKRRKVQGWDELLVHININEEWGWMEWFLKKDSCLPCSTH